MVKIYVGKKPTKVQTLNLVKLCFERRRSKRLKKVDLSVGIWGLTRHAPIVNATPQDRSAMKT